MIQVEQAEGFAKPVVRLLANGQDFIALVATFEQAFAPDLVGEYFPINSDTLPPSGHFHFDRAEYDAALTDAAKRAGRRHEA